MPGERKYFSDQRGLRRPSTGLIRDSIPEGVRHFVGNYVFDLKLTAVSKLWRSCVEQLDLPPYLVGIHGHINQRTLIDRLETCNFPEFLDLVSAIYYFFCDSQEWSTAEEFRNQLNDRFLRHHCAYEMLEDGGIEDVASHRAEEVIAEARALLTSPDLVGPDRQFQDAVLDFHRMPNPDFEGAVASALNAVEGVVRIALDDIRVTLGDGIKQLLQKHQVHGAVGAAASSLYGYASQDGGRHGLVGAPKVDRTLAEYCLHQAAATIVFVARLEGWEVVEGDSQ